MSRQKKLQEILSGIPGVCAAYFNPPENVKMSYPCIRYTLDADDKIHADNRIYKLMNRYTLTVIDKKPNSSIPDVVRQLPYCSFDRSYVAEGLYHFVFTMYY